MRPKLSKKQRRGHSSYLSLLRSWWWFWECTIGEKNAADWVNMPKWRSRYKALLRSQRNHGYVNSLIEVLQKVQAEYLAQS